MIILGGLIMALIILMQFAVNQYLYGYNQTEYCHQSVTIQITSDQLMRYS